MHNLLIAENKDGLEDFHLRFMDSDSIKKAMEDPEYIRDLVECPDKILSYKRSLVAEMFSLKYKAVNNSFQYSQYTPDRHDIESHLEHMVEPHILTCCKVLDKSETEKKQILANSYYCFLVASDTDLGEETHEDIRFMDLLFKSYGIER